MKLRDYVYSFKFNCLENVRTFVRFETTWFEERVQMKGYLYPFFFTHMIQRKSFS
jgi:hypothetical protein